MTHRLILRTRCSIGLSLVAGLLWFGSSLTQAATPAVLVDRGLEAKQVNLLGLGNRQIIFFDDQRVRRSRPIANFVQLRAIGNRQVNAPASAGRLVLTDGQRLMGEIAGSASDGQAIRWRHPELGTTMVDLTNVLALIPRSKERHRELEIAPGNQPLSQDILKLANNDTLRGFLQAFTDQRLQFITQGSDKAIGLPIARIRSLRLANPTSSAKKKNNAQRLVVLSEGTRLLAGQVRLADEQLQLANTKLKWTDQPAAGAEQSKADASRTSSDADSQTGRSIRLPMDEVVRIDLTGEDTALKDLAAVGWKVINGGKVFGVDMPPKRDGADLLLHAPVELDFDVAPATERFAATVSLDPPSNVPEDRLAWAQCTLRVHHGQGEPTEVELSHDNPTQRINLPVTHGTLRLELASSTNGPILDRVRMRNAILLQRAE